MSNNLLRKTSNLRFYKTREVPSPTVGTPGSAGVDFFVPLDFPGLDLLPGHRALIPSGLKVQFAPGHALIAFNKSGVAAKKGLLVGACVVDSDYAGEVHLHVVNTNRGDSVRIEPGEKLVQFLLVPVVSIVPEEVDDRTLAELQGSTERGAGGFGSTNLK